MRKFCVFACLTLLIVVMPLCAQQPKKRVAVLNFEYGTVHSNVAAIFGTNTDVGRGIADLLVEKLVNNAVFSVIERKIIDKIIAEQNFSNSDRADTATAAKIGKVLGVDAIIVGSITTFGRDDKSTNIGGNVVGSRLGRYGIGGIGRKEAKAVVALTARLINTDTAEILSVANGKGESERSGTLLLGAGGSSGGGAGGAYDMTSANFGSTIIGEATIQAVDGLTRALEQNAARIPTKKISISGLVADVSGATLIVNVGSNAGVKVGDVLEVGRTGKEVRDPASGRVIYRKDEKLGEVKITEVTDLSSVGTFTGTGDVKVGDSVKNKE